MNAANPKYPDFYVFGIVDFFGSIYRDVAREPCDTVYVEGHDENDDFVYFEDDAYHLETWAKEHGFTYFKYGYTYDSLGEPFTAEVKHFD